MRCATYAGARVNEEDCQYFQILFCLFLYYYLSAIHAAVATYF